MAILRSRSDLTGATLYVARINRRGDAMMSRPCSKCQKIIQAAGIKRMVYTVDNSMEL